MESKQVVLRRRWGVRNGQREAGHDLRGSLKANIGYRRRNELKSGSMNWQPLVPTSTRLR